MSWFDFNDIPDWVLKNECEPFEDSLGNLCITVKSKYESFGGEQDARLDEAKKYGVDRLIRFYGKTYNPVSTSLSQIDVNNITISIPQTIDAPVAPAKLYDAASTPDFHISPRECVRMKVLVKIPKDTFDDYTVNNAACDINKPAEGFLSAFISVENYERDIDYITTSMEDFLPKMAKADKYMTNINIVQEIKNLKRVKSVIKRYFNLNSVTAAVIEGEECELNADPHLPEAQMEIGFSYDYKPAFALIDGNKHTIGYDCFLEASKLNHPTTANYLLQLGNMSSALTKQLSLDFDIFQFLTQHTYPTPVIKTKENSLDGIEKYDAMGNLFSFANLAKLITLDLDKKSCKTDGERDRERFLVFDDATKANIASTVRQSEEFVGNNTFSESEEWKDLKETGGSIREATVDSAITKIYNDVLDKIDFNCVLEESLKCSLEAAITRLGEEAFNDPDLSEFFNADGVIELFGLCEPDSCDNQLQLKVGLPAFQGIAIPANFPTIDYLAKTMDTALKSLYNILINAIVSFITGIFELMCKAVSATDFAAIGSMFGDGFKSWLSKTIGVDVSMLGDGEAWADAVLSAGGEGFMGVVGNFVSKTAGSMDSNGDWVWGGSVTAVYSGTGVSLNLPNPGTGLVEQVFVSPEFLYQTMSGFKKATESLETNLTPEENNSIYKGSAPEVVVDMAHECLSISNPEMFESPEDVTNLFSALGKIVDGNFLEDLETIPTTITNACDLGDGSSQDILAANYLRSKDPLLSDSEIEELLSKEKNRLIEKVKKIHKLLKQFQDGTLFPSFPSLFGSDDSLISEVPPIIADAMKTVASGMYGSAINNLNTTIVYYPDVWGTVFKNKVDETSVNLEDLYSDSQTRFSVDDDGDKIAMGYSLSQEPETIPSEEYVVPMTGLYMTDGWWYYDTDVDLGSYTSEATNPKTDPDQYPLFRDMLNLLGLKEYEASDRKNIIKEIQDMTELLRDFLSSNFYEFWADVFTSFNFLDKLNWDDLNRYRQDVKGTMQKEMDNIFSQLGVTMEDWVSYDNECQQQIWDAAGKITAVNIKNTISDNDDVADFNKVVEASSQVNDLYYKAKAALVVMDIADFLEDWDDAKGQKFIDMDEDINWGSGKRSKMVKPLPEYIDGSYEEPIGKVTLVYNITDVMLDTRKEELALAFAAEDPDNLVLKAHITFKTDFEPRFKEHYVKTSFVIEKEGEDVEVVAVRDDDWSEAITTFERKGARRLLTSASNLDFGDRGSILAGIRDAITSGGNEDYDIIPNNKIITSIGNYKIANDLAIALGRKESKSNLLEEKYSFNTDNDSYTLSSWFANPSSTSTTAMSAGKYAKLLIDSGGSQSDSTYTADYTDKMQGILDDMRERVMTSQYRTTGSIGEMIDSYAKSDAIKYEDFTKWAGEHVIDVMKIQQLDEMCDALTPNRRTAASMGVRMLAREFILESALISLQVFDTFNTGFMESEAFRQTIFDNMKTEMKKYSNSFEDTLENNIFTDIKDAAVKYYEYRSLLGEEVEISSGKSTLISIINEEIGEIRKSIVSSLQLSENGTWDDFVFDEILPTIPRLNIVEDYNDDEGYYFVNIEDHN